YLPAAPRRNPAFDNAELTWSGPIEDLPLLDVPRARPVTHSKAEPAPDPPPAEESVDAYHPRQRIYTDPAHPTHPRQTLINPAAPAEALKFLPQMPNIVQLAAAAAPARPRVEISEQALAKLHPQASPARPGIRLHLQNRDLVARMETEQVGQGRATLASASAAALQNQTESLRVSVVRGS